MKSNKIFNIINTCKTTKARTGILSLSRGQVSTPIFMPIATIGSIKSLTVWDLKKLDIPIILGNTYHLWLRPGLKVLNKAGGLHNFIHWDKPILTDSGGFQAFSLGQTKFVEDGVIFRSHLDGKKLFLSPERSIQIQSAFGSDIMLVLDQALAADVGYTEAKKAMYLTQRWAKRCKNEYDTIKEYYPYQGEIFGIPQGAQFPDLRKLSAELTMELDFPGYSIGGVANGGEPEEMMYEQVLAQTEVLEIDKPKHLLGVGTPKDLVQMVARGIDMFDCVYPTRNARHGTIFLEEDENTYKKVHINSKQFEYNFEPINPNSVFPELQIHTKAYLRHLFKSKELLAFRLATLQNLEFYINLMNKIRTKINNNRFGNWYQNYTQI